MGQRRSTRSPRHETSHVEQAPLPPAGGAGVGQRRSTRSPRHETTHVEQAARSDQPQFLPLPPAGEGWVRARPPRASPENEIGRNRARRHTASVPLTPLPHRVVLSALELGALALNIAQAPRRRQPPAAQASQQEQDLAAVRARHQVRSRRLRSGVLAGDGGLRPRIGALPRDWQALPVPSGDIPAAHPAPDGGDVARHFGPGTTTLASSEGTRVPAGQRAERGARVPSSRGRDSGHLVFGCQELRLTRRPASPPWDHLARWSATPVASFKQRSDLSLFRAHSSGAHSSHSSGASGAHSSGAHSSGAHSSAL